MTTFQRKILFFFFLLSLPLFTNAQVSPLPWLKNIDPKGQISTLHTIRTAAQVTVSDGLEYQTNTLFHDKQRAVFQQIKSDKTTTLGVEGRYTWEYDGLSEQEGNAATELVVLGHQLQAQMLFFDQLHDSIAQPEAAVFAGTPCQVLSTAGDAQAIFKFFYDPAAGPLGLEIQPADGTVIRFRYEDWRPVSDIVLPFRVWIDDGSRTFEYRFSKIEFNTGALAEFHAPEQVLTEAQKLLRRHRAIMDAHLFGQADKMSGFSGDAAVILSEGEVYEMTGAAFISGFERMLSNRDYTVYDDLIRPKVNISADGSLGWVIAQVEAKGLRLDTGGKPSGPLSFVCAWIELYEKADGQWKLVGNVSNFQAGRQ